MSAESGQRDVDALTERIVRASDLRAVRDNGRFQLPSRARVTEVARAEARQRGIELVGLEGARSCTWREARARFEGRGGLGGLDGLEAGAQVPPYDPRAGDLASYLDHTLLRVDARRAEIRKLCDEARQFGFASVCVQSMWVAEAVHELAESAVLVCSVVGFPSGAAMTRAKVAEARAAVEAGAREVDMVVALGALTGGEYGHVEHDIAQVAAVCHYHGAKLKVILETCLLDDVQKKVGCYLAGSAGADFVKTSTGFSTGGATVEDVALMRATVGRDLGVKASGGIRDRACAEAMLAAGASRLGTSASIAIVDVS